VGFRVVGFDCQCLLVMGDRFVNPSLFVKTEGQIITSCVRQG